MKLIPKHTLLMILGRSEPWLRSVWNDRRAGPMPNYFNLLEALMLLNRCPKRMRVWTCNLDLKLPLPTWRIIRTQCQKAQLSPETFIRALICRSIDDIRTEKIDMFKSKPAREILGHGGNIRFKKFVVYGLCGLKLIAIAYKTSVSAVVDWLLWLWIEEKAT